MAARPRRASTAAMAVFPAPEQPVIWTALIGIYRRPALMAGANEFVIPRGRTGAPRVLGLQPGWPAPDSCQLDAGTAAGADVERPTRAEHPSPCCDKVLRGFKSAPSARRA
jgi:hypothetical protein